MSHARRRSARTAVLAPVALAATLVVGACSSSEGQGPTGTRGTSMITAPVTEPAATDPASPTSSTAPAIPGAESVSGEGLELEKIADADTPIAIVPRSGTTNLYVAEQAGRVRQMTVERQLDADGNVRSERFRLEPNALLDIRGNVAAGGERGLLGMAFSSDGRKLYVDYTDREGRLTVDEYRMNDDSVDTSSRRNLISVEHERANHNGGQLAIGPDGFLYIAMGDGGGAGDPDGNGQNPGTVLGTILRIDPEGRSGDLPYAIPAGNPFGDGEGGAPEVWTWGLRNPWRFSFDRETDDLWIADVGQNSYEEINFLPAQPGGAGRGANMGWSVMEGTHPFEGGSPPDGAVAPIFDYDRANGECSVTGGHVYRGARLPSLVGVYVYADFCKDDVRGLLRKADGTVEEGSLGLTVPGGHISSFGQDGDGELFVVSHDGPIYRLTQA